MGVGPHSTLARISILVERARENKGRSEVLADRIAAVLVPLTILISMSAFAMWYFGPMAMDWVLGERWPGWLISKGAASMDSLREFRYGMFSFLFNAPSFSELFVRRLRFSLRLVHAH